MRPIHARSGPGPVQVLSTVSFLFVNSYRVLECNVYNCFFFRGGIRLFIDFLAYLFYTTHTETIFAINPNKTPLKITENYSLLVIFDGNRYAYTHTYHAYTIEYFSWVPDSRLCARITTVLGIR